MALSFEQRVSALLAEQARIAHRINMVAVDWAAAIGEPLTNVYYDGWEVTEDRTAITAIYHNRAQNVYRTTLPMAAFASATSFKHEVEKRKGEKRRDELARQVIEPERAGYMGTAPIEQMLGWRERLESVEAEMEESGYVCEELTDEIVSLRSTIKEIDSQPDT